jgi:hypothetical protein
MAGRRERTGRIGTGRRLRTAVAAAWMSFAVATVAGLSPATALATQASSPAVGTVRGHVVSPTGAPVADARVTIPADRLATSSRTDGSFVFAAPVAAEWPYRRVSVVVTASGWGRWEISGAPLYPGDQLILRAQLRRTTFVDRVQTPAERAAGAPPESASPDHAPASVHAPPSVPAPPSVHAPASVDAPPTRTGPAGAGSAPGSVPTATSSGAGHGGGVAVGHTCTGWEYQLVPPPTIWVYRTGTGVSEQYDFVFYATHVLPNEWISAWDADALGAGAIAVRTYAAWRAMPGHAYSEGPNCGDVRDTIDGLFDPSWTTASASQAVYAAWGSIVYQNGGLFVAHYFAGPRDNPCAYVEGQYAGWMSQWGTQNCALAHEVWPDIVDTFYDSDTTPTSWHYLRNLLLNPSISSDGLYEFHAKRATFAKKSGTGADGTWYLSLKPKADKQGILYQHRSFLGTADTAYHDGASVRCPVDTGAPCTVTLRVTVYTVAARKGVAQSKVFTVPNDGTWHAYAFDPSPFDVDHQYVRAAILTTVPVDVDKVLLTAPYGGP